MALEVFVFYIQHLRFGIGGFVWKDEYFINQYNGFYLIAASSAPVGKYKALSYAVTQYVLVESQVLGEDAIMILRVKGLIGEDFGVVFSVNHIK